VKICIVANPAAGRGRAVATIAKVRETFAPLSFHSLALTGRSGDEQSLAKRALNDGCDLIVAVGGDGTCSRIANAILHTGSSCAMAVVPCGTGNDFAKTLGVHRFRPDQIASLVRESHASPIDVGRLDDNYFLNSCGFGFDASVLEATQRAHFLKGDAVYIWSALRQLFTYRGVDVSVGGADAMHARQLLMLTVSNGQFLGGAFRIAPRASVVDGLLDVCLLRDSNIFERVRIFAGAFRGTHVGLRSVETRRVEVMNLTFVEPPMMEIDGELRRARFVAIKIECRPRALNVIAAAGALR
jgi:diacylglycerol kinase (ATP)